MRALWPERQNCSHNVSQKVKRIRSFSDSGPYSIAGEIRVLRSHFSDRSGSRDQNCSIASVCVVIHFRSHFKSLHLLHQGGAKGGRQKEFDHFFFRDSFGHFLVTFSDASVTFLVAFLPDSFCRTPFVARRL